MEIGDAYIDWKHAFKYSRENVVLVPGCNVNYVSNNGMQKSFLVEINGDHYLYIPNIIHYISDAKLNLEKQNIQCELIPINKHFYDHVIDIRNTDILRVKTQKLIINAIHVNHGFSDFPILIYTKEILADMKGIDRGGPYFIILLGNTYICISKLRIFYSDLDFAMYLKPMYISEELYNTIIDFTNILDKPTNRNYPPMLHPDYPISISGNEFIYR